MKFTKSNFYVGTKNLSARPRILGHSAIAGGHGKVRKLVPRTGEQ